MPKYAVTVMLKQPQQIVIETPEGKDPIELTSISCTLKENGKTPILTIPREDFVRCDRIMDKPRIVTPTDAERAEIIS